MQTSSRPGWFKTAITGLLALALTVTANAANVHFVGDPVFQDTGENLDACFKLAGLGNKDITVTLSVTGTATVIYFNPGGNEPPGQNKVPITAVTSKTIPASEIKNGTVSVCLESPDVVVPPAPNENWVTEVQDVSFETATITVTQKGKTVLNQTFDLD